MENKRKGSGMMRLYNIFYICKLYYPIISKLETKFVSEAQGFAVEGWVDGRKALEAFMEIECLCEMAKKSFYSLSGPDRWAARPLVSRNEATKLTENLRDLKTAIEVLIKLHDCLEMGEAESGIDIKIPQCDSLKEYMSYLKDIDFIFTQCPFLISDKEQVKFKSVDVGSQWLAFVVLGSTAGYYILNNLALIIKKVIEIRSNLNTYKLQEEMLAEYKRKGEVQQETIDVFKRLKQAVLDDAVESLELDIESLNDGEERDKVKRTIELMNGLIDKGVEIYSSIETPKEIKVLFPFEKDTAILPDNLMRLIEEKNKK